MSALSVNMADGYRQRVCRIIRLWSSLQSQEDLHHLLHLGFIGSTVATDGLLNSQRSVLAHLQLRLCQSQHRYAGGLAYPERGVYMFAHKEFLHRRAFGTVESQELRELI